MGSTASPSDRTPLSKPLLPPTTKAAVAAGGTIVPGQFGESAPEPSPMEGIRGGAAHNFQPSKEALLRYLSTRKFASNLAGVTFPGLFADPHGADAGWFRIAVIVELISAALLSAIVVSVYDLPPIAGLLPFVGFVGLDLALAIGHHWPLRRARCLHKNQALLVVPDLRSGPRQEEAKYRDFLLGLATKAQPWHRWLSMLCVVLIIVVAIGKTLFLAANIQELGAMFRPTRSGNIFASRSSLDQILQRGEYRTAILLIFGLLYSLVAYIHINHTGYALASWRLIKGLKRDQWLRVQDSRNGKFRCEPHSQTVDLRRLAHELRESNDPGCNHAVASEPALQEAFRQGLKVNLTPAEQAAIAPHAITANSDGTFEMIRVGILTDEQLSAWSNMQPLPFAKLAVALYGHKLQLHIIGGEDIDAD